MPLRLIGVFCLVLFPVPAASAAPDDDGREYPYASGDDDDDDDDDDDGDKPDDSGDTLISGTITHGGMGGPFVKATRINKQAGIIVGGRGGWIINHSFVLGGGGYGLAGNMVEAANPAGGADVDLQFGAGGLWFEYIIASRSVVHISVDSLLGAGGGCLFERTRTIRYSPYSAVPAGGDTDDDHMNGECVDHAAFFVAEPSLNLELNVVRFLRVTLGAGYRFAIGESWSGPGTADMSGVAGTLMLKFGKF